jgi:cytochrome c oxidase subunit 3
VSVSTDKGDHGPRQASIRFSIRQLGVFVLFGSLSVLFAASLVGYLITRSESDVWRPEGVPGLPLGLVGSSVVLFGNAIAMHHALGAVRANKPLTLLRDLWIAFAFALAFVVGQALNWSSMWLSLGLAGQKTLYAFTFYMLTGLHVLHVLGGLIPLGIVISRAQKRQYSSSNHEGVLLVRQYWDFLGIVWLVLLTMLYLRS